MTGFGDEANIEGDDGQALFVSIVDDDVRVGVAGAVVVDLRRVADNVGYGAENNEKVEIPRHVRVEVSGVCDLGSRGRGTFVHGHVLEYRVLPIC